MSKLQEIMKKSGFIDYDVIEFGKIVIQECIKAIDPSNDPFAGLHERQGRNKAIQIIMQHFGIKQ